MRVLFIVPYPFNSAPSQHLKFEQYFAIFENSGIECIFRPFMSGSFYKIVYKEGYYLRKISYTFLGYAKRIRDLFEAVRCDIIYLHLEAAPFGPSFFEYLFKLIEKPIIYDIDDVIFLANCSSPNKFVRYLRNPKKTFNLFKLSDHVIVVTNYLRKRVLEFNNNVTFIPPTIDTKKYYPKKSYKGQGKLCIGWSGSSTTSAYLRLLENPLKEISQRFDIKIKVIGDAKFKINGLNNLEAKQWECDREIEDLQQIDIGLYPLPDTEWIMGKGGLKALQYMGAGIPVVCSRRGACLEFIKEGENGFFADSNEEWIKKISLLIENEDLRKDIGAAGRKTVEDKFSVEKNAQIYLDVFNKVYKERYL